MALELPPTSDRKRVKVYELRDNDWFDRGTGFCLGHVLDVCVALCFLPRATRLVAAGALVYVACFDGE